MQMLPRCISRKATCVSTVFLLSQRSLLHNTHEVQQHRFARERTSCSITVLEYPYGLPCLLERSIVDGFNEDIACRKRYRSLSLAVGTYVGTDEQMTTCTYDVGSCGNTGKPELAVVQNRHAGTSLLRTARVGDSLKRPMVLPPESELTRQVLQEGRSQK